MFDLLFVARLIHTLKMLVSENINPKILCRHQAIMEQRARYMKWTDAIDMESDAMHAMRAYVLNVVIPYFGLTYRPPSSKLYQDHTKIGMVQPDYTWW